MIRISGTFDDLLDAIVIVEEAHDGEIVELPGRVKVAFEVERLNLPLSGGERRAPRSIHGATEDMVVDIGGIGRAVGHHLQRRDIAFGDPQLEVAVKRLTNNNGEAHVQLIVVAVVIRI